jgi:hypothetical protein
MIKNKWMLVTSVIVLAIGSAFVTKGDSTKTLTSYFENTLGCPSSICSPVGGALCGHDVWNAGCQMKITDARRD